MLLNQLVRINEAGIVADSVNFSLMEDWETNQKLCEGFVFNYDKDKPEESTIGVLEALRSSYDSRSHANIHLLIQQYGKGKSHFAVAIANYFGKPIDSPEVEGILHQVENAAGRTNAIAERLRLYKKRGRHLVLCLSGDSSITDLKKQFLQVLLQVLEKEEISNSVAQHICSEPLRYIQSLKPDQREQAEDYLASIGNPDGDLTSITKQLQKNNPGVISTLKNLAKHLTGFVPDWNTNVDIEGILKDLITQQCSGENPRYQGVLILFDELNFYLQNWAKDPIGSGGTALQNITNICEAYKSKISLLSFTQIDPSMGVGIPAGALEDHRRLVSRLAPKGSTYQKVASSLELVLDNLLIQDLDSSNWQAFSTRWNDTLLAESTNAYQKRITTYREKGWTRDKFHQILTVGCFPLHPLTAYLLCNLDFTVDRTALQFIKTKVKVFIENQPLTREAKGEKLNFIYPISLVEPDTFLDNFAGDSNYTKFMEGASALAGSDDPNELIVLKGLFLFHASGGKLTKADREAHEDVLASLTGLTPQEVKTALDKLVNTRDLVYYKPELKLYRFWAGVAPTGIEKEIEEEIRDRKEEISVNRVVAFCQQNIEQFLGSKTIAAKHFVDKNKLVLEDWQFEHKVYTIDGFERALSSDQTLRGTEERGILAFVLAETQPELQDFRRQVDALLAKSPIRDRIAVAIPNDGTGELASVLLKIQTLKNKEVAERRSLGAAYDELLKRWNDQVATQAGNLLKSCTYHCVGLETIPPAERENAQRVVSTLLQNLYPFVPQIEGIDKLRSGHTTGRKVIGFVSRQLLADNLTTPLPDNTYSLVDTLFVSRWKLLKKTSRKYTAHVPENERVKTAWDVISKMTDLGEQPEKIVDLQKIWKALSEAPYGYNEYTFTILLAAWLSYHRKEVALKGNGTIPAAGKKGATQVTVEIKSLKDWATTNILEKPDEFVKKWIVTGNAKVICRKRLLPPTPPESPTNYNKAEQYLLEVQAYLDAAEPDPSEVSGIIKIRDQVESGVSRIREWFQPVENIEPLIHDASLEQLLNAYPKLHQPHPKLVLRDDVISVQATPQQRDRQAQALELVTERIQQLIEDQSARVDVLETEHDCETYKAEVQRTLDQINQVSTLPPYLPETLQYALQAVDRRSLELKEVAKTRECLSKIQNCYKALSHSPTQQEYILARQEIETLAHSAPAVTEEEIFEQTVQEIEQRLNDLTQQVEIWEEQSSGLDSPDQIHALIGEINGRCYRFTEETSARRISKLLDRLKHELDAGRDKDEAIRAIKTTLANAIRKLERIRDVAANKLQEAFQSYQELTQISLPTVHSVGDLADYQKELEDFKAKGRLALISEGFSKIYNLELKRLEDYARLKVLLEQRLDFIKNQDDFEDVKASLEQALQRLEARHRELQEQHQEQQKKAQDEQIIRYIHSKYKLPRTNTVQFLEDGIQEIKAYQAKLYEAESFASELEQLIYSLQEKVSHHHGSLEGLRDRLIEISTLNELSQIETEHARLELVFKDSSAYPDYLSLQQQIQQFKEELEMLQILDNRCQQSISISSCHEVLSAIYEQQKNPHCVEKFQAKLAELGGVLQSRIESYIQDLHDYEHIAQQLTTAKEAQNLHEELLKQSVRYAQSEVSDRYETISTSIRLLVDLLRIAETETIKTLQAYEAQAEKLRQWQESAGAILPFLQERFESVNEATEKVKAQILRKQQTDAEKWVKNLESQLADLNDLTDALEKGKLAIKLLQKIQVEQLQHADFLCTDHQATLKSIEKRCDEEIAQDRENQIKRLFKELPHLQRISLYRQLEKYLSDPTEEFDG
ncbi:MAG: hypothetical protein B0A82_20170 [Alkalinema sp. CACIAM 70d]|nr:MAG: hypothetical protein B0A82_20170 [Alkalinema sp. CACIAM 70d]